MTDLNFARTRLESALATGRRSAGAVIEQVLSVTPTDAIVPVNETGVQLIHGTPPPVHRTTGGRLNPPGLPSRVRFRLPNPAAHDFHGMTDYSFGQLLEKTGIPIGYGRGLLAEDPAEQWRGGLLVEMLNTHLANSKDRMLVRRVGGDVRGILSDKFKRMDSRPGLEAFVAACKEIGAEPVSGHSTETRVAVRAIIPRIYEPVPGEAIAFGLHWGNSDFGNGSYHVTAFMLRLACFNGMVGEKMMHKTHVGARLADDVEWSKKTLQLSERALASATQDTVRLALGPAVIDAQAERIRAAHSKETDFKTAWATVGKSLTKQDQEATKAVFESADEHNVPAGRNMWRFANALSWVANADGVSEERKLDLQAVAGKLV